MFIDRDGTLVKEPPVDYQLDSLEKLEFVPKVMRNLYFIRERLDFEFVMVSNQDGLGTPSFPEETFWPAHNLMLTTLEGEGIVFDDILIDPSFPEDNSPNRKPRTGMLTKYMTGEYDLENSFVIGDRLTDMELAPNLGAQGIWLRPGGGAGRQGVAGGEMGRGEVYCRGDGGAQYAAHLAREGVPCEYHPIKNAMHGYDIAVNSEFLRPVMAYRIEFLRKVFTGR